MEINVGKGKTEYQLKRSKKSGDVVHDVIRALDGKEVECVDAYTYLGQQPGAELRAFNKRKALAWCAVRKFDQLWKSSGHRSIKEQFFKSIVQTVFVYGGQGWPSTAEWTRRIDTANDRMMSYCLGCAYNTYDLHDGGRIPMLSSVIALRRVNTVGHALRREQPLSLLLGHKPKRIGRKLGIERTIVRDLRAIGGDRDEWFDHAADRAEWRDMARRVAATQGLRNNTNTERLDRSGGVRSRVVRSYS